MFHSKGMTPNQNLKLVANSKDEKLSIDIDIHEMIEIGESVVIPMKPDCTVNLDIDKLVDLAISLSSQDLSKEAVKIIKEESELMSSTAYRRSIIIKRIHLNNL
jgi:hypothetical protein